MNEDLQRALDLKEDRQAGPSGMSRLTKSFLYSFILFLSISALISIVAVLGGKFSEFEVKVILTSVVIALSSICCMCCGAFIQWRGIRAPGYVGMALALLAGALLIIAMWAEIDDKEYYKVSVTVSVFAIAFAHFLVLCVATLKPGHLWVRVVAGIAIFCLAALISGLVIGEDFNGEGVWKLVAVLAIVVALTTLTIPILHRIGRAELAESAESLSAPSARDRLVLTPRPDGTYAAGDGRIYRVTEIPPGGSGPA
jgi:hypothetical protein